MELLELDGKALFAKHGIPIPVGAVWPDVPDVAGGMVIKAQLAHGGRGKRGGIQFADDRAAVATLAERLSAFEIDGVRTQAVYVEEKLDIARESYLSIVVDRDAGGHVLIAAAEGGVEIEALPKDKLLRLPIDPLIGLRPFHIAHVVRHLGATGEAAGALAALIANLYALARDEDAMMAEINPLVTTGDGRLVAADAKVSLDANAAFRHGDYADLHATDRRSPVERAVAETGGVAVEIDPDGDVIGVVSGAGLMMATLDIIAARGLKARCMVDLGGSVLRGPEGLATVFSSVFSLGAPLLFVNSYLQTGLSDGIAEGFRVACQARPFDGEAVFRLKGRRLEEASQILAPFGHPVFTEFREAIDALIAAKGRIGGVRVQSGAAR